jgi:SAM-dependent methyltransferase
MPEAARYDGVADWYDEVFLGPEPERSVTSETAARLLGSGSGRCLDVGCGTGVFLPRIAELGWEPVGIDESAAMLRRARRRAPDVELVRADAAALPFPDRSFDAAVSLWTHTDIDDFGASVREVARVLRSRAPFVYAGAHPCFVGPHSRFARAEGVPTLHPGYWAAGRYADGPGVTPDGLRARVGASHLPLGSFLRAFLDADFRLEALEELRGSGEYPYVLAARWRR